MNNYISSHFNSTIKKSSKYYKILIFPLMLFGISSCFENQEIVPECDPCISPTTYEGYTNILANEFNSEILDENWGYVEGNGCPDACGWGNGELQSYNENNIKIRDGNLVIIAKKEIQGESLYTSGRISTFNTFSLTFGRIDVRAKLPKGQGVWAGIWLLGNNIKEVSWPTPGHISLMEMRGGEIDGRNSTIHGKIIWGVPNKIESSSDFTSLRNGIFNDKFHVFSIIWEPTKIQWLLDDKVYFEKNIDSSMNGTFSKPFHLNINLAVGGQFPGNPDNNTVFPQEMIIDYIRVFQK